MRKSNNYNKFLEYIAFGVGSYHGDAVNTDNGVLECVAEAKVEDLEGYSRLFNCKYDKMTMDSDTWLKFKVVLVNEEVIEVYYVADSHETHIDTFLLDNFRTQKDVLTTVHQKVVEYFLNSDRFCKLEVKESNEHKEISDVENVCGDCSHFNACMQDYETNASTCCMFDSLNKAIRNPEWHHVSLATLANLNFDMLDRKRQVYLKAYRELKRTLADLSKCKTGHTYEARARKFFRDMKSKYYRNVISHEMRKYLDLQISMSNVINGVWSSYVEAATGCHESRRYSRTTLPY